MLCVSLQVSGALMIPNHCAFSLLAVAPCNHPYSEHQLQRRHSVVSPLMVFTLTVTPKRPEALHISVLLRKISDQISFHRRLYREQIDVRDACHVLCDHLALSPLFVIFQFRVSRPVRTLPLDSNLLAFDP